MCAHAGCSLPAGARGQQLCSRACRRAGCAADGHSQAVFQTAARVPARPGPVPAGGRRRQPHAYPRPRPHVPAVSCLPLDLTPASMLTQLGRRMSLDKVSALTGVCKAPAARDAARWRSQHQSRIGSSYHSMTCQASQTICKAIILWHAAECCSSAWLLGSAGRFAGSCSAL